MKKLLFRIILVFVVITVVASFFIGDYISRENEQMWERYKEKPTLVTAEQLDTEQNNAPLSAVLTAVEDDKNAQVLRIETLSFGDKLIPFTPEDDVAGATSLNIVSEVLGRPKTVKPYTSDCGVQDASIADFGNIQFKKIGAEYYLHNVTLANSKFELRTPRLLMNKETKLADFKNAYNNKTAVLDSDRPLVAPSASEPEETNKKDKKKGKEIKAKTTDFVFSSSGNSNHKWIVSFDSKGAIQSVAQDDASCKKEEPKPEEPVAETIVAPD